MKELILCIVVTGLLLACGRKTEEHQHPQTDSVTADTVRKSIPKEEHAMIGSTHFTIKYYAPAVRGRVIWGGLVPYGNVWVTGAHHATSNETNSDIAIDGKVIPAGKYGFFTIPGKEKWTVIFNKNWEQHLADDYDQSLDVARIEVLPTSSENLQERLQYSVVKKTDDSGEIVFWWEKLQVRIPFTIK